MKKRMLAIFVLLVLLAGALLPAVRAAELDLPAPSYVLMERSTGRCFWSTTHTNASARRA